MLRFFENSKYVGWSKVVSIMTVLPWAKYHRIKAGMNDEDWLPLYQATIIIVNAYAAKMYT